MCSLKCVLAALALLAFEAVPARAQAPAPAPAFGRVPGAAEIKLWDIDVRGTDGQGLPVGHGDTVRGKAVFEQNCAACHGVNGVGGIYERLAGGQGSLATDKPIKTVGSFWPYAPTLFDYIRRAMPYPTPGSLSTDDTYAVAAYILQLNAIVPEGAVMDQNSLPRVRMPNRDGFVPEPEYRVIVNSRR